MEEAFVEAILNEADDHAARLAFADWLSERDDPREQLVRAQGELGPSVFAPGGAKLVPIPAGSFTMGSPDGEDGRDPDEQAHLVRLTRPYYLGATPVTVAQYAEFVEATGYETVAEQTVGTGWDAASFQWHRGAYSWREPGWEQDEDEPVVCLTWDDARLYCAWLSERGGREYRLPSEAEWEYACRACTTTAFSFGNDLTLEQANFVRRGRREGPGRTTPVASYPANAFGLYDLHGNAWEWCADWYGESYYPESRRRDPTGPLGGHGRVLRGGAWCVQASDCRSALRRCGHLFFSRYQDGATGFRVALNLERPRGGRRPDASAKRR